jgi:hypothetical protein
VRTIGAIPGERGSVIVASVSEPFAALAPVLAPLPSSCTVVSRTGAHDTSLDSEVLGLTCRSTTDEIVAYYDRILDEAKREERRAGELTLVTYVGSRRQATLAIDQVPADPPTVTVNLSWQEFR